MLKNSKYIFSGLVLAGITLSGSAHAAVINWGANFTDEVLNNTASMVDMFMTPLGLIVSTLLFVIAVGAIIGYLKH